MHSSEVCFFFNDTATTEIYTLSLHDALPILGAVSLKKIKEVFETHLVSSRAEQSEVEGSLKDGKRNKGKGLLRSSSQEVGSPRSRLGETGQNDSSDLDEILEHIQAEDILSGKTLFGFESFMKCIINLKKNKDKLSVAKFIEKVMKKTGYYDWLDDKTIQGEERQENLKELLSVAEEFAEKKEEFGLEDFLEEVALISDVDNYSEGEKSVTLMTLHSAKGLEFPCVFIAGMEEGIFPHSRTQMDVEEMEEERRLAYVGITRAKERVYLISARRRLLYGNYQSNPTSRFISDIPGELIKNVNRFEEIDSGQARMTAKIYEKKIPKFHPGEKVLHDKFGMGIVQDVKGDEMSVAFEKIGAKNLSVIYAPIEKVN